MMEETDLLRCPECRYQFTKPHGSDKDYCPWCGAQGDPVRLVPAWDAPFTAAEVVDALFSEIKRNLLVRGRRPEQVVRCLRRFGR